MKVKFIVNAKKCVVNDFSEVKKYIVDDNAVVLSDFKDFRLDYNGTSYLVIYSQYINGWFIALPEEGKSCIAAEAWDVDYNKYQLENCGIDEDDAKAIAKAINELCEDEED